MKLLAPAFIFCGAIAGFGQSPQVPHKMQFAGMTLTIRDEARREIQADVDALTRSPKYFNIKAERARTYFPIIEEVFADERLPEDFKYLSLQESALVPDAVSSSNAVGFWQFKEQAAAEMGLRMDGEVDERMNIASASRAAAKYLKQCNHYFNNWVYALQAYQMGAGGVMRAVGDKDLGARHMEINSDTYWYVKKFLAHKVAFEAVSGKPALEVLALRGAGGKRVSTLADEAHIDEAELRTYNKWLKTDRIPEDKEYLVLLPRGEATTGFHVLSLASVTPSSTSKSSLRTEIETINGIQAIKAHEGENLSSLIARANISMGRFLNYNEMDIDQPVRAGTWYFLAKKKKRGTKELYTVQPGEDLWAVSQQFGVRTKSLMKYNDLEQPQAHVEGTTLYLAYHRPGVAAAVPDSAVAVLDEKVAFEWDMSLAPQKMAPVPNKSTSPSYSASVNKTGLSPAKAGSTIIHEVKASDTLYSVARQYGVTIREIMDWNGKKDFGLAVGEKLKVTTR